MTGQDIIDYIKRNKLEDFEFKVELKTDTKLSNGKIEYYCHYYGAGSDGELIASDFKDNDDNDSHKTLFLEEDEALYMRDHNEISHKLLYQFNDEKKKK